MSLGKEYFSERVPKRGSERDSFRIALPNEPRKGTLFLVDKDQSMSSGASTLSFFMARIQSNTALRSKPLLSA